MRYALEPRPGYLLAQLAGRNSAEDMRAFLLAVHAACAEHRCPKVLMTIRASRAMFRPEDYGLSGNTRGYANELVSSGCQVALVGDTPELHAAHEYIELVARQQAIDVRAFRDEAAAARWLLARPEPSRRYRLGRLAVQGAPAEAGVYALWDGEELVYYGRAASLRARLEEHLEQGPRATHYGWELCADAAAREAELLREFELMFGRRPRHNAA